MGGESGPSSAAVHTSRVLTEVDSPPDVDDHENVICISSLVQQIQMQAVHPYTI